jgi:hypothetical protein
MTPAEVAERSATFYSIAASAPNVASIELVNPLGMHKRVHLDVAAELFPQLEPLDARILDADESTISSSELIHKYIIPFIESHPKLASFTLSSSYLPPDVQDRYPTTSQAARQRPSMFEVLVEAIQSRPVGDRVRKLLVNARVRYSTGMVGHLLGRSFHIRNCGRFWDLMLKCDDVMPLSLLLPLRPDPNTPGAGQTGFLALISRQKYDVINRWTSNWTAIGFRDDWRELIDGATPYLTRLIAS